MFNRIDPSLRFILAQLFLTSEFSNPDSEKKVEGLSQVKSKEKNHLQSTSLDETEDLKQQGIIKNSNNLLNAKDKVTLSSEAIARSTKNFANDNPSNPVEPEEKIRKPLGSSPSNITDHNLPKLQDTVTMVQSEYSEQGTEISIKIKLPQMSPQNVVNIYQENIAQISDSIVIQTINSNLPKLADELSKLRQAMIEQAEEPDHYRAIANISEAEKAVQSGDGSKTFEYLKRAGKMAFGIAKEIGVNVVSEVIKKSMGL
jgi:hypothetical protein